METREEEISEISNGDDSSKFHSTSTPNAPDVGESPKKPGVGKCICGFFGKIKKKIQSWFPEVGMFNKMSISEEEKKEIKD